MRFLWPLCSDSLRMFSFVQTLLSSNILYSSNYIIDIEKPYHSRFHSFLLNLHFAIKVSEAEVLTELIIKSVPVHS